ncbi:MAG: methylglyoxal synthase [Synechococcales cyanobacterium RM1_1_8]|nr:methylglyoxal synthase [Synechococcales cyanobacterium RM1_1_8]
MSATIALIAHDSQKEALLSFARQHQPTLARYRLIATEGTSKLLQDNLNLNVQAYAPAERGGDIQIGAALLAGMAKAVIVLQEPARQIGPSLAMLLHLCDLHGIPCATNLSTAGFILAGLAQLQQAHLIFNPVSGQGDYKIDLAVVQEQLGPHFNLKVHLTTPEQDAQSLAQAAIAAGADLVIASGGDGTVSAVASALIGTEIPLGVIPRGTANAFCVALGISSVVAPIRTACHLILEGHTRKVDAAKCNDHPMVLLAGIGFEAETVEKASREFKDQWGMLAYVMAGWSQLDEHELFSAELLIDGDRYQVDAGAITVANAAPPTSVLAQGMGAVLFDDGLLDVTIVTAETKLQAVTTVLSALGASLLRSETNHPNISQLRASRISITANPPQKVVVDGEIVGTTPVELTCLPDALTVIVPQSQVPAQLKGGD